MESIKIKPGETFELIVIDDKGNEIMKQYHKLDTDSINTIATDGGMRMHMDLIPVIDKLKLHKFKRKACENQN